MTKFSWEPLDGGSLLLKVADGDRETTWKITKRTPVTRVRNILWEMESALDELTYERMPGINARPTDAENRLVFGEPLRELVRTVDDVELAELREDAEKASRAAQQAKVDELTRRAQWWDNDDEDMFVAELPDYDSGEIK